MDRAIALPCTHVLSSCRDGTQQEARLITDWRTGKSQASQYLPNVDQDQLQTESISIGESSFDRREAMASKIDSS